MSESITYNAPPTTAAFMRCSKFLRGLMGPFGSGKSVGCIMDMLKRSLEQAPDDNKLRRTRWAIIRNTYPELRDTTRATFEEWVPGAKLPTNWSEQEFTFTLKLPLPDGTSVEAEFLFRALDRPEDVKKLLSLELTGAWINEAREVAYSVVKMLTGRVGRFPSMRDGGPSWSGILMDTNPPDTDSWWYQLFEETKPENAAIFKQPGGKDRMAENLGHWEDAKGRCVGHYPWQFSELKHLGPVGSNKERYCTKEHAADEPCPECMTWVRHLRADYYDNLTAVNATDPLWLKVHVHAQYGPILIGKPIYPEYNDNLHTVPAASLPILKKQVLILGADFGLTPALSVAQRDPRDGQLQIIDEIVSEDMGASRFFEDAARYLRKTYPGATYSGTGDPGGDIRSQVDERTPYDIASAHGISLVPAHTNDFEVRRDAVGGMLTRLTSMGRPAMVVSDKCQTLRKAMCGGYCLKRVAAPGQEAKFREVPDKNIWSHIAESVQYLALGEGEDSSVLRSRDRTQPQRFKTKIAGARRNWR